MNRRTMIAATVGMLGVASHVEGELGTLRTAAASNLFRIQSTRRFSWDTVTPQDAMYLGIMATWDEVSFDMVLTISEALDTGGRTAISSAANQVSGGIHSISADIGKVDPSPAFVDAHDHFDMYIRYLARGVTALQDWGGSGSESYLRSAIKNMELAAGERQMIVDALPYPLPDRKLLAR